MHPAAPPTGSFERLRLHRLEGREPAKVLDGDRNQSRDRPPDLAALRPMGGIYTSVVAMVTQAHTFSAGVPILFAHLRSVHFSVRKLLSSKKKSMRKSFLNRFKKTGGFSAECKST